MYIYIFFTHHYNIHIIYTQLHKCIDIYVHIYKYIYTHIITKHSRSHTYMQHTQSHILYETTLSIVVSTSYGAE